jgi:hypothetical protein
MKLAFELTGSQDARLRERAAALGVSPEDLVRAAVMDLLARPEADFEEAVEHVLTKNRDLYDRLS